MVRAFFDAFNWIFDNSLLGFLLIFLFSSAGAEGVVAPHPDFACGSRPASVNDNGRSGVFASFRWLLASRVYDRSGRQASLASASRRRGDGGAGVVRGRQEKNESRIPNPCGFEEKRKQPKETANKGIKEGDKNQKKGNAKRKEGTTRPKKDAIVSIDNIKTEREEGTDHPSLRDPRPDPGILLFRSIVPILRFLAFDLPAPDAVRRSAGDDALSSHSPTADDFFIVSPPSAAELNHHDDGRRHGGSSPHMEWIPFLILALLVGLLYTFGHGADDDDDEPNGGGSSSGGGARRPKVTRSSIGFDVRGPHLPGMRDPILAAMSWLRSSWPVQSFPSSPTSGERPQPQPQPPPPPPPPPPSSSYSHSNYPFNYHQPQQPPQQHPPIHHVNSGSHASYWSDTLPSATFGLDDDAAIAADLLLARRSSLLFMLSPSGRLVPFDDRRARALEQSARRAYPDVDFRWAFAARMHGFGAGDSARALGESVAAFGDMALGIRPDWPAVEPEKALEMAYIAPKSISGLVGGAGGLARNQRVVDMKVSPLAFARQGTQYSAFYCADATLRSGSRDFPAVYALKAFGALSLCELRAELYAVTGFLLEIFKERMRSNDLTIEGLTVPSIRMVTLIERDAPFYGTLEPLELEGAELIQFTRPRNENQRNVAKFLDTFMHWTYQRTNGQLMVKVDKAVYVDGWYWLVDPEIYCKDMSRFGSTNLGAEGMDAFLSEHRCGSICSRMALVQPSTSRGHLRGDGQRRHVKDSAKTVTSRSRDPDDMETMGIPESSETSQRGSRGFREEFARRIKNWGKGKKH